jgi:hypothetical protein
MQGAQMSIITTTCVCLDPSHIMQFTLDELDTGFWELGVNVQLNPRLPWWKRIVAGVWFMLGRKSKYGHWDVGAIDIESAKQLRSMVDQFLSTDATR